MIWFSKYNSNLKTRYHCMGKLFNKASLANQVSNPDVLRIHGCGSTSVQPQQHAGERRHQDWVAPGLRWRWAHIYIYIYMDHNHII